MQIARIILALCFVTAFSACGGGGASDSGEEATGALATLTYRGVSLAGAEFGIDAYGAGAVPGTFGVNYTYPDPTYVPGYTSAQYYSAKGMNTFRIPFRWERLQPTLNAALDAAELARLTTTVNNLTASGSTVIIDPHNYARYGPALIGSATVPDTAFADLWSRLATTFKSNSQVLFGLMNEPHDMLTESWVSSANAAIVAIRATGANNLILVPGNGWTGAGSWSQSWYGTANATAMLAISDPGNNYAFEVHQYFDSDSSGTHQACVSATVGSQSLQNFTTWLHTYGKRGFLGEFGASSDPTCLSAIDDVILHMEANADVYLGWTYWAGGPWWGVNWMALEPTGGVDTPQMTALLPHLAPAAPVPTCVDGVKNGAETGVDCGGSCAPCPVACTATSYPAASMSHSTGAATPGGWKLALNGDISTSHTFAAGKSKVTVTAAGTIAAGVFAHMVVSLDGVPVGNAYTTSKSWLTYPFFVTTTAGAHSLSVAFDNDYASGNENRDLRVAKVVVGCPPVIVPVPPAPTCSDGAQNGNETGVDCGGSCVACGAPGCTGATYPAASMTHSVGGAAGSTWNLWSNGYAAQDHTFTAGASTITVNASGSVAAGIWPHMVVSVGGATIGSADVASTQILPYVFPFTALSGSQEIRVTFDNDLVVNAEDRNLTLESVVVSCGGAPALPSGATLKIMPLGDSITLGVNGGYRNGLWDRLVNAGKSIDFVGSQVDPYAVAPDKDHEGHPGFTIGNVAGSASSWLTAAAPDYVLLMIGTNDVAWWCAQTADQVADQNALLIDQILGVLPNAWVVVAAIPPLTSSVIQPNNFDRAQLAVDYNAALLVRVQTRVAAGKRVRFADVYSSLTVADLYDGVHPTQAAADKVAQVWYDALTPLLP